MPLLIGYITLEFELERVAVLEDAAELKERACHPEAGIAEQAAEGSEPSQGQAWRRDERVRVEDAPERDVHEEALRCTLGVGEPPVFQVAPHDARVVSSVPVARGRARGELQPKPYGLRRGLSGPIAGERDRFTPVLQQPLVDRAPPDAARRRCVE